MPEARILTVTPIQEMAEFTNRHKDLSELSKAKSSISTLKKQFQQELDEAIINEKYMDPYTKEWYEDIVERLDTAQKRIGNVATMLRVIHLTEEEKEQTDGRTEE